MRCRSFEPRRYNEVKDTLHLIETPPNEMKLFYKRKISFEPRHYKNRKAGEYAEKYGKQNCAQDE